MNDSQETETTAPVECSEQGGLFYARPAGPHRALAARYIGFPPATGTTEDAMRQFFYSRRRKETVETNADTNSKNFRVKPFAAGARFEVVKEPKCHRTDDDFRFR